MASEDAEKFVALCQEFVRSMSRTEEAVKNLDETMSKEEQREALRSVFTWIDTTPDLPANSYAREWARELLAQISAFAMYDTYDGSPDSYIV